MKTLIVVESPSKAITIQKYVGDDYVVVATGGHMVDLGKGGNKGIGIDVYDDFKPHYVIIKEKMAYLDRIIQEATNSSEILIASDPDREGEAIAYHLKVRLESSGKPISRVEFMEITKQGIESGIGKRRSINMDLFKAQETRRILDRIVGFMVSPFLINHYGQNLSAGRVQSVAVRMIVDKEKEIDTFIPEEYWNILAKFETDNKEAFVAKFESKVSSKDDASSVLNTISAIDDFVVMHVMAQKKKEKPPPPLTTAKLQQYMARKFSFDTEKTMRIAQHLYESGYCTYIRTDSIRSSNESIISGRNWLSQNGFDIPKTPIKYSAKDSAQDAHECIRPTNVGIKPDQSIMTGDDLTVYKTIWQHFLASQMPPAVWSTLTVRIASKSNPKISFKTSGKSLDDMGYLKIFGDVDPGKIEIPNLKKDQSVFLLPKSIKSDQKFTQPPARYNEASINEELESKQIGRPATYAEIIKKITARNYVEKKGSTFRPTELGRKITDILVSLFPFMEYEYTSNMEKQLDEIAVGRASSIDTLRKFFIPFKAKLDQAYISKGIDLCDKCKSPMIERTNSKDNTKFMACSGFPKCRHTISIGERNFTNVELNN